MNLSKKDKIEHLKFRLEGIKNHTCGPECVHQIELANSQTGTTSSNITGINTPYDMNIYNQQPPTSTSTSSYIQPKQQKTDVNSLSSLFLQGGQSLHASSIQTGIITNNPFLTPIPIQSSHDNKKFKNNIHHNVFNPYPPFRISSTSDTEQQQQQQQQQQQHSSSSNTFLNIQLPSMNQNTSFQLSKSGNSYLQSTDNDDEEEDEKIETLKSLYTQA